MPYTHIQNLDEFWEKLWQQTRKQLILSEPDFANRFITCRKLGFSIDKCHEESIPLLSGKFTNLIDLIVTLHETRYYWKRLSEAYRLFNAANIIKTNPLPIDPEINESEWFIYHLDFWWHASYSFFQRFRRFLIRLEKNLNIPQNSEINNYIKEAAKASKDSYILFAKVRDPIAHYCSQGLQGLQNDHVWEGSLILKEIEDTVDVYDQVFMYHRDYYEKFVSDWTYVIKDIIDNTFNVLNQKLPFNKIEKT